MVVVGVSSTLAIKTLGRSTTSLLFRHRGINIRHRRPATTIPLSIFPPKHNHSKKLTTAATLEGGGGDNAAAAAAAGAVADSDTDRNAIREAANTLDIRVGRIVRAWKHEEADSLYVEEVDIGGGGDGGESCRIICSGLVKYIPLDLIQDKKVVVLANLKPRNMRGVKSFGMLMAASDSSHENIELLEPPESSLPGDRIWFGDVDDKENLPDVASPNQIQKKKIWELVQPHLKTNGSCVAVLGEDFMRTSSGVVRCRSLKDANIS